MKTKWEIKMQVRKQGAIGIYYSVLFYAEGSNRDEAEAFAMKSAAEQEYEVSHVSYAHDTGKQLSV